MLSFGEEASGGLQRRASRVKFDTRIIALLELYGGAGQVEASLACALAW